MQGKEGEKSNSIVRGPWEKGNQGERGGRDRQRTFSTKRSWRGKASREESVSGKKKNATGKQGRSVRQSDIGIDPNWERKKAGKQSNQGYWGGLEVKWRGQQKLDS